MAREGTWVLFPWCRAPCRRHLRREGSVAAPIRVNLAAGRALGDARGAPLAAWLPEAALVMGFPGYKRGSLTIDTGGVEKVSL